VKENINLYSVEAKEINPPAGLEAAHWILITTLEIDTFEESLMIVVARSKTAGLKSQKND
jgi:hypothetical protein